MMMNQCTGDDNMENLNLEKAKIEGQFGLMLREKDNHDNYIHFTFEDLEKVIEYFENFKNSKEFERIFGIDKIKLSIMEERIRNYQVKEHSCKVIESKITDIKHKIDTYKTQIKTITDDAQKKSLEREQKLLEETLANLIAEMSMVKEEMERMK